MNILGKISKDWGGIFDEICVANVKINLSNGEKREQNKSNFNRLSKEAQEQLGEAKFLQVLGSDEYRDLYDLNLEVFNLIEQAKKDTGLAKRTDDANHDRFLKKAELQKKFFETDLTEVKIGYSTHNER